MAQSDLVISRGTLTQNDLKGKTVLITGGGGGIGLEAARACVWLGAAVILAEVDKQKGLTAERAIQAEFPSGRICFFQTDISKDSDIDKLHAFVQKTYGMLDVIVNNATITPLGEVHKVGIANWDKSYAVNLRAPVLLLEKFLPDMKARNSGTIVFVPSSGAAPYMGAYEVFKTAQVELCNTLSGELEGTNIITYSIGPGLVKTATALKGIETVSQHMGISADAFIALNEKHMLDTETAGAGFAASIALAERYNGKEVSSIQVLLDAQILGNAKQEPTARALSDENKAALSSVIERIAATYDEQYEGWLKRNVFERQWVLRDFKKTVGRSTDQVKNELCNLLALTKSGDWSDIGPYAEVVSKLKAYYEHQIDLLSGYEKDPKKLQENVAIITGWIADIQRVLGILGS